jgi:hypothetical protein
MAILALVYDDGIPRNEIQCPESWVESWWHREKPTRPTTDDGLVVIELRIMVI